MLLASRAHRSHAPLSGFSGRAAPALGIGLSALLGLGGCTAVPALVQCRMAAASLHDVEGQAARAPESTYDLTLARAYLDKAREESSEAHYGLAIQLAKSSRQASERVRKALDKLRSRAQAAPSIQRGRS